MILSILAGLMIAIAAGLYLIIGGPLGAGLFAIGLLTILLFELKLFTGKAGLLAQGKITPVELLSIWCGNFVGACGGAFLLADCGLDEKIGPAATAILNTRITNEWYENVFLGVICGILMYIAVSQFKAAPYLTIMCVAAFILFGANHCVADMVYMSLAATTETLGPAITALFFTTIGNLIGTNIIPFAKEINQIC